MRQRRNVQKANWEIVRDDPHGAYPRYGGYRYPKDNRPHQVFVYAPSYTVQVPRDYQLQAKEQKRRFPWGSLLSWTARIGFACLCFYLAWLVLAGGPNSLLGAVKAVSTGHLSGLLPPKPF